MDTLTRADTIQGSTYNGHPLAMAAVIAAIEEYEKDDGAAYAHIEKLGNALRKGLVQIAEEHGQPLLLQGFPGAWVISFTSKKKVINHREGNESANHKQANRFSGLLKERGVLTSWRFCTSAAHTEKDVQDALDRANDAMKVLKEEFGST